MTPRRWIASAIAATAGVALCGVLFAARWALAPAIPGAPSSLFRVEPGASLGQVARGLEARGIVRSALAFEALARYRDLARGLQAGEFRVSPAMSPAQILERFASGLVETYAVVIPEGLTAVEVGQRLAAAGLVDASAFHAFASAPESAAAFGLEGATLEGYLFPETYRFPSRLSPRELAAALVAQFRVVWNEIEPQAKRQKLSMREVVTLASIVEKETAAPEERPLIASVFRNRLQRGMRLETDPTVIYGIENFDGNLRRRDLENRANPYNTYVIPGLPPGPIANPGADSLRAVVNPADSDYLFFVSRNDGTHVFSKTFGEHELAVNRYQRR